MATNVDICNLALSHLGDSATVSSIDPPEGSAQAEHCARHYPIALATITGAYTWTFATRRLQLAEVSNPTSTWQHAYAKPSGAIDVFAILDPNAPDDYSYAGLSYTPQKFVIETDSAGREIILTNQELAVARYTRLITDTSKFPPMFVEALSCLLASKLAGPVIKGAEGRKAALDWQNAFTGWLARATTADAKQRHVDVQQSVSWVSGR